MARREGDGRRRAHGPRVGATARGEVSDANDNQAPFVARLGDDRRLWGAACVSGAYNRGFRLFTTDAAGADPREANLPGEDDDIAFNPTFDGDGMTLSAFYKGRGPGDCGTSAAWTWNGRAFDAMRRAQMAPCRGVPSNDWPPTDQARIERAR